MIPEGFVPHSVNLRDDAIAELLCKSANGKNWRRALNPYDDITALPDEMRAKIEAHRTPERVAIYDARQPEPLPDMPPEPEPRDLAAEIDTLKAVLIEKNVITEQDIERK